uniref:Type I cytokine receptor cytokine-binding domain-containing protein n=1 Tax=Leptobrachium leishanense TaxID=445787 RepID=A0A8C5Q060_9ANUR
MGIMQGWHNHIALGMWLSVTLTAASVSSVTQEEHLSPPTNLVLKMNMSLLQWEWKSESSPICQIRYRRRITQPQHTSLTRSPSSCEKKETNKVDLNGWLHFSVNAECPDEKNKSKSVNMSTLLVSGNTNTAVRNFNCEWYNMEYINCTWSPGEKAPPEVNYTLIYWQKKSPVMELKEAHALLYKEFLGTSDLCYNYTLVGALPIGCHFEFRRAEELHFVVADISDDNIQPFYSSMETANKLQLPPPIITNTTRLSEDNIYVSWTVSPLKDFESESELVFKNLKNGRISTYTPRKSNSIEINVGDTDSAYSIKVRSKKDQIYGPFSWSEWSQEKISPGKSNFWTISIILAIVIPLSVIILTIIAVVCMKRFLLFLLPPVPDPGKIFKKSFGDPNSLQQFIKYTYVGASVWNTPQKDDICSVVLVETPLNPHPSRVE